MMPGARKFTRRTFFCTRRAAPRPLFQLGAGWRRALIFLGRKSKSMVLDMKVLLNVNVGVELFYSPSMVGVHALSCISLPFPLPFHTHTRRHICSAFSGRLSAAGTVFPGSRSCDVSRLALTCARGSGLAGTHACLAALSVRRGAAPGSHACLHAVTLTTIT